MNPLTSPLAIGNTDGAPLMLKIIFWLLLLLWAIGSFGWHDNPAWVRGSNGLLIVLFAILGYFTFGF